MFALSTVVTNRGTRRAASYARRAEAQRAQKLLQPMILLSYTHSSDSNRLNEQVQTPTWILAALADRISEPKTHVQARKSPDWPQWEAAELRELKSLENNKCFTPVILPPGTRALPLMWLYKLKYDDASTVETRKISVYKARLVVLGNRAQAGVDYDETFSPVIRAEVLRILFTIAASEGLHCEQMDVRTAFLNANSDRAIYVRFPPGHPSPEGFNALLLLKSVYGLRQAPRLWFQCFVSHLVSQGWTQLRKDTCVFIKIIHGARAYIGVYVDDITILASTSATMLEIKQSLNTRFSMHELGPLKHILGWHIVRDLSHRLMFVHQAQYTSAILRRFGLEPCNPVRHPLPANIRLTRELDANTPNDAFLSVTEHKIYRAIVGSLMYLMTGTRPDIAFLCQQLSQFISKPTKAHMVATKHGLRYLQGTIHYGIRLGGSYDTTDQLKAYADSDYANCIDTRRCVSGYITYFRNSPISWISKKMPSVVLSTTEAEYMALCLLAQECLFLRHFLTELGIKFTKPITLYEDNQSTIKLVKNPELHGRSKHIQIREMFLQEQVHDLIFTVLYCATSDQLADIFTKALPVPAFETLRRRLGLCVYSELTVLGTK